MSTRFMQLVLSEPFQASYAGDDYNRVMDDRYHQWYNETHLHEMMTVPYFVAGQRYELISQGRHPDAVDLPAPFFGLYEIEGESMSEVLESMWPKAKGWAGRIPAAASPYTWKWWSLEERGSSPSAVSGTDFIHLVFSEPMDSGYGDEEYDSIMIEAFDAWYDEVHLPSQLELPGFITASRWNVLEEGTNSGGFEWPAAHCALYGIDGDIDAALAASDRAAAAAAASIPAAVRVDTWRWWTLRRLSERVTG